MVVSEARALRGKPGFAAELEHGRTPVRIVGVAHAGHWYVLVAIAPEGDAAPRRFIESFTPIG